MSNKTMGVFYTDNLAEILQVSETGTYPITVNHWNGITYKLCGFLEKRQDIPVYRPA